MNMKMKRFEPIYSEYYNLLQELMKISYVKKRINDLPFIAKDSIQSGYLDYLEKENKAIRKHIVTSPHNFEFLLMLQKHSNSVLFSVDIIKPEFNKIVKECETYLAKDSFGFDGTKFWLNKIAGKDLVIDFNPKKGETTDTLCLMKALVDYIKNVGELTSGWLNVIVPTEEIKNYIRLNYPKKDVGEHWITSTRNNLLQKMTTIDKKIIIFKLYDRQKNGYPFSIKLPLESAS